jgi:imidazoleglycerol-phosphate dehydratase/histidinol-phosphatase
MSIRRRKIAFVDRDGTIIEEPPDEQVDRLDKIRFLADVIPSMLRLRDAGFEFVMVTNQDGLGTSSFPTPDFEVPQQFVLDALASQGIVFAAVHVDPTWPAEGAETRKPGIGMVRDYLKSGELDFDQSIVIGDRDSDIRLAKNMGLRAYRVTSPNTPLAPATYALTWPEIVSDILNRPRTAVIDRSTRETKINGLVALEETGTSISTGIGFFDHMLDQIAVHGGFRLELTCDGDLDIDEHHTIEDCGLALGGALSVALKDRRGIGRFGFVLPMDEAQATIAVDLGGRPYLRFDAAFPREAVGGMPTEMVEHFFRSLSQTLGATIHIAVVGENAHHMVEAIFKGFGRAMRPALARDASSNSVPSSKGVLV